jgi:hypothetical protein
MNLQAARSKFEGHVRRGIFQPVARHVPHDTEDRMQDAIAQTWAMYCRYADHATCAGQASALDEAHLETCSGESSTAGRRPSSRRRHKPTTVACRATWQTS